MFLNYQIFCCKNDVKNIFVVVVFFNAYILKIKFKNCKINSSNRFIDCFSDNKLRNSLFKNLFYKYISSRKWLNILNFIENSPSKISNLWNINFIKLKKALAKVKLVKCKQRIRFKKTILINIFIIEWFRLKKICGH